LEEAQIVQSLYSKRKVEEEEEEESGNKGGSGQNSVVARMMAKMGYKEGKGLGKQEQGIVNPLQAKKTDRRAGIIVGGESGLNLPTLQELYEKRISHLFPDKSTVVLLTNMVGPGEIDQDLQPEIVSECNKFGKVEKCVINEDVGVPPEEAVKIYIKFEALEAAAKAIAALNGRFFGGRSVLARYYDEGHFATSIAS